MNYIEKNVIQNHNTLYTMRYGKNNCRELFPEGLQLTEFSEVFILHSFLLSFYALFHTWHCYILLILLYTIAFSATLEEQKPNLWQIKVSRVPLGGFAEWNYLGFKVFDIFCTASALPGEKKITEENLRVSRIFIKILLLILSVFMSVK